jgi:hypothetical protein
VNSEEPSCGEKCIYSTISARGRFCAVVALAAILKELNFSQCVLLVTSISFILCL